MHIHHGRKKIEVCEHTACNCFPDVAIYLFISFNSQSAVDSEQGKLGTAIYKYHPAKLNKPEFWKISLSLARVFIFVFCMKREAALRRIVYF